MTDNVNKKKLKDHHPCQIGLVKLLAENVRKKGHLAFNCPAKYENKPYKSKNDVRNRKEHISETAANATKFAGSATPCAPNLRILPTYKSLPPLSKNCEKNLQTKPTLSQHKISENHAAFTQQ